MTYRLISETSHVANKEYRCIWCGEKILRRERYIRERSVYDNNPQIHKWHEECRNAGLDYFRSEGGEAEFSAYDNERGTP